MNRASAADDQGDVERVLAGDLLAFERIVRRWQAPLVNLAFRFCRERGRAEEMAQEAFLCAFRSLSTWRRQSAFSTWLFAIAANVYRTELRRLPPVPVPLADLPEPSTPAAGDTALESSERDRILRRAVLALPPKYRDAIVLFYFHDMDISAAARTLRLPEGTVKTRLARGRQVLRAKLPRLFDPRSVE